MNGARKPNAMLIELVIVILFFSISAGIMLQLFVAANDRGRQNSVNSTAVMLAEDTAELFAASHDTLEAYFSDAGWVLSPEGYERSIEMDDRLLRMVAQGETEQTEAGTLDTVTLTVYDGERAAVILPMARYVPGEDMQ